MASRKVSIPVSRGTITLQGALFTPSPQEGNPKLAIMCHPWSWLGGSMHLQCVPLLILRGRGRARRVVRPGAVVSGIHPVTRYTVCDLESLDVYCSKSSLPLSLPSLSSLLPPPQQEPAADEERSVLHLLTPLFLAHSYTVLTFNSRGVGSSTGRATFTGEGEVSDLKDVVSWGLEQLGGEDRVGWVVLVVRSSLFRITQDHC